MADEQPKPRATRRRKTRQILKTTNVRHEAMTKLSPEAAQLIADLKEFVKDEKSRGFDIGDKVEAATNQYQLPVKTLVEAIGLSRQQLSECRVTARAFDKRRRRRDISFHVFTLAARAADSMDVEPSEALDIVVNKNLVIVRAVRSYFAALARVKANGEALQQAALVVAKQCDLVDRCHAADFRDVVKRLAEDSVKLVIADPSYDGKRRITTSATIRAIDGNTEADARKDITDLLKTMGDKMATGGAIVIFRPGAAMDPAWLPAVIRAKGWVCEAALTWNTHKPKLGRTGRPYGIASERLLVLHRKGEKLTIYDDSPRDDVLEFSAIQPCRTDVVQRHQHEKPLALMRHLVSKHTYEGELIFKPFSGSGPASRATIKMNHHRLYAEINQKFFATGSARITQLVKTTIKSTA
ncbi:MAG: DNA methyltransferase [Planctomycetota bacterium]